VPYPLTLPSHASILTGRLPYGHGARRNDSYDFDDDVATLATVLRDDGYATGAIVSTFVLNASFGLERGFDTYADFDSLGPDGGRGTVERRGDEVADLAIAWLDEHGNVPFFLWTHFFDPHDLYTPPPPYDALYADDLYAGEVAYTDGQLGRVLRRLEEGGAFDDALVVLTSDHGEALGEHGETGHGFFLYSTTLRVPLILHGPMTAPRGTIREDDARSIDILPTVCDVIGRAAPDSLDGWSLFDGSTDDRPLYVETFEPSYVYGATELKGVVDGSWKLIDAPRPELYDLERDPAESDDVYSSEEDVVSEMREILEEHERADEAFGLSPDNEEALDDDVRRKLASLGYVGGVETEEVSEWERQDPKDIIHLLPLLNEGMALCRAGDWRRGTLLLERVLAEDPVNGRALYWVSHSKSLAGDAQGAIDVYHDALELQPTNASFLNTVGLLQLKAKQPELAIRNLEAATQIYPEMVAAHLNLARAYMAVGRARNARAAIRRAYAIAPENPMVLAAAQAVGIKLDESSRPGG
jgi:arylsulfatase A-like enzyme/Flp pilus assembly protein TadD